jgi:hypothetical protein
VGGPAAAPTTTNNASACVNTEETKRDDAILLEPTQKHRSTAINFDTRRRQLPLSPSGRPRRPCLAGRRGNSAVSLLVLPQPQPHRSLLSFLCLTCHLQVVGKIRKNFESFCRESRVLEDSPHAPFPVVLISGAPRPPHANVNN